MRVAMIGFVLLSGCYIVAPDTGSSGDDSPPPPPGDGGGSGPVGRTFSVSRQRTSPSCGVSFFEENLTHSVDVERSDVRVDGSLAANTTVFDGPASEANFDSPNVTFTVFESWESPEGSAFPEVNYQLWISGDNKTGDVNASFEFGGTICSYTWRVQ